MQGSAHFVTEAEDGSEIHRALTTKELFSAWRIPPTALELFVRRMAWHTQHKGVAVGVADFCLV